MSDGKESVTSFVRSNKEKVKRIKVTEEVIWWNEELSKTECNEDEIKIRILDYGLKHGDILYNPDEYRETGYLVICSSKDVKKVGTIQLLEACDPDGHGMIPSLVTDQLQDPVSFYFNDDFEIKLEINIKVHPQLLEAEETDWSNRWIVDSERKGSNLIPVAEFSETPSLPKASLKRKADQQQQPSEKDVQPKQQKKAKQQEKKQVVPNKKGEKEAKEKSKRIKETSEKEKELGPAASCSQLAEKLMHAQEIACTSCKNGKKTVSVISEGKVTHTAETECFQCDGTGKMTLKKYSLNLYEKMVWCKCDKSSGSYHAEDGWKIFGNDTYLCSACDMVTQFG